MRQDPDSPLYAIVGDRHQVADAAPALPARREVASLAKAALFTTGPAAPGFSSSGHLLVAT